MKELIEKVVQWGVDRGLDKVGHLPQAKYTLKETAELLDAYADGDIDAMNDAIGDILVTLIVGASNDADIIDKLTEDILNDKQVWEESDNFFILYRDLIESCQILFESIRDDDLTHYEYMHVVNSLYGITLYFDGAASLKECLELAYNEIESRTGKMINGQFVKDR